MKRDKFPVSRKVFEDISNRINTVLASTPLSAMEAMRLVTAYLNGEKAYSYDTYAIIAFNMIRAELDRAMERSRRARERAANRKTPKVSSQSEIDSTTPEETVAAPKPAAIRLSRRERRALERQKKKHLAAYRPVRPSVQTSKSLEAD